MGSLQRFAKDIYRAFPSPLILCPFIVAIALTGPFGTFGDLSFIQRVAFWGIATIGCGIFFNGSILLILMNKRLGSWHRVVKIALGCAIAAFPGSLLLMSLDNGFRGHAFSFEFLAWLWLCVAVVGLPVSLVQYSWRDILDQGRNQPTYAMPLMQRVPQDAQGDLISLAAQDHYVKVTTSGGSALILMNFSEALAELDGYPGLRIHRSYWVAHDGIEGLEGSGRTQGLRTKDGNVLPISRSNLAEVRAFVAAMESAA